MAKAETLADYYKALLADTLSANEQMLERVRELGAIAVHPQLREMIAKTGSKIPEHNRNLEQLLEQCGGKRHSEHCKGMEGIAAEAKEHAIKLKTDDNAVRDAAIIHAMQQMSHYGIAGYGTAAALADVLGRVEDANMLRDDLKSIYMADEYLTVIAESEVNPDAA
jgi:ferritin-like metal-binding protein YciE